MEEINKQSIIDEEHLRLLVIFHRIYGIAVILLSLLGIVYYFFLNFILRYAKGHPQFTIDNYFKGSPVDFMNFFLIIMLVFILIGVVIGALNILSAQYIKKRKSRIFSMVIACIDCFSFPLGSILGVLTLIVLSRHSVIDIYKSANTNMQEPL